MSDDKPNPPASPISIGSCPPWVSGEPQAFLSEATTTAGVYKPPPDDGSLNQATMFPRNGKLYLFGVRSFYSKESDIQIRLLHPRSKEPLVHQLVFEDGFLPGYLFNPDVHETMARMPTYEDLFVLIGGQHHPDNIEPVYCNTEFPLIVEAKGSELIQLSFWGSPYYQVTNDTREYRGPYTP